MNIPKVSIVVPCWGVEKYLDKCIDSLVNQTLKEIEIILVDDESPDRVPEMCEKWAQKDSRIKVIHKKNAGLGMACNTGLAVAKGEYIAFCDSDDWVDLNMYESLYSTAIKYDCDAVYSGLKDVTLDGQYLRTRIRVKNTSFFSGSELKNMYLDMISSAPHIKSERVYEASAKVVLYCKKTITDNNIKFVSERLIASEDQIFNLNFIACSKKICILPNAFYNYRINMNSISRSVNLNRYAAIEGMFNHIIQECETLGIEGDYLTRAQRIFIASIRGHICQIYNSQLSYNKKRTEVNKICNNPIWKAIWNNYPIGKMAYSQRFFSYCMKYKIQLGMLLFAKLR